MYLFGDPQLVLVKTNDSWRELDRATNSTAPFQTCVDDEYALVAVCVSSRGAEVHEVFATISEMPEVLLGECNPQPLSIDSIVTVTGSMLQPGLVFVGASGEISSVSPWTFEIPVRRGDVQSLIASDDDRGGGGANVVGIRRGLSFDAASVVEDVDLTTEGQPTLDVDATVVDIKTDESVFTSTTLVTSGNFVEVSRSRGSAAKSVPGLMSLERQYIQLVAEEAGNDWFTYRTIINEGADFGGLALMPRVDEVARFTDDGMEVSWDEIPVQDYSRVVFSSVGDNSVYVTASKKWIDVQRLLGLTVDQSPPGFDPTWISGSQQVASFELDRELPGLVSGSAVSVAIPMTGQAASKSAFRDVAEARRRKLMRYANTKSAP